MSDQRIPAGAESKRGGVAAITRKLLHFAFAASLFGATAAYGQTPASAEPPTEPLPAQLAAAHKLFIGNAGDQENADCLRFYNAFYAGVQGLHRFQLVLDPSDADLILELHYEFSIGAGINGGTVTPRQFRVIILDPRTHVILWSLTERTNYAVFQKNRDKNLDETIHELVQDFAALSQPVPTPPSNRSVVHH
jgi:hypothetical protein